MTKKANIKIEIDINTITNKALEDHKGAKRLLKQVGIKFIDQGRGPRGWTLRVLS